MKLRDLHIGEHATVTGYAAEGRAYRQKLLQMGATRGTELTLIRKAPLGDPVEVRLRGFSLTLRKDEADALDVERIP
jgi:ferrous iron transport protein A